MSNPLCDICHVGSSDVRVGRVQGFFEGMVLCSTCAYKQGIVKYGILITTKHWATEAGDIVPLTGSKERMESMAARMREETYPGENENCTYEVVPTNDPELEKLAR